MCFDTAGKGGGGLGGGGGGVGGKENERCLIFTMQSIYLPSSGERLGCVGNNI